jgi:hypothetical protein
MGIAQIILVVWFGISLLASAHLHGKERKPHNFWIDFITVLILFGLLWWGGFFY